MLGGGLGFKLYGWDQVADIGRVQTDLHLAAEPSLVLCRLLLMPAAFDTVGRSM